MKFLNREFIGEVNTISPALPWDWNQMPPLAGFFSLTVFYQGLKHEHVTDFSGRDTLLSHE